jgi:hypothetical protein
VVFEYTEKAGLFKGNRTWKKYPDEETFKKMYKPNEAKEKVIAQGISSEEALFLINHVPLSIKLMSAVGNSFLHGQLDEQKLKLRLDEVLVAENRSIGLTPRIIDAVKWSIKDNQIDQGVLSRTLEKLLSKNLRK